MGIPELQVSGSSLHGADKNIPNLLEFIVIHVSVEKSRRIFYKALSDLIDAFGKQRTSSTSTRCVTDLIPSIVYVSNRLSLTSTWKDRERFSITKLNRTGDSGSPSHNPLPLTNCSNGSSLSITKNVYLHW